MPVSVYTEIERDERQRHSQRERRERDEQETHTDTRRNTDEETELELLNKLEAEPRRGSYTETETVIRKKIKRHQLGR